MVITMRVCVRWRGAGTQLWCALLAVAVLAEVASLSGPNVCMVKQKYNITKRVKYRAPMSVRTYEWCFSMPPRCSRWSTEMRDLTRLETEERTAEVAVCCPGYKMKDVSCVPICPYGKTGPGCSDDCPENKWGPNCAYNCSQCTDHGVCSPLTGDCECEDGWQGESCEFRISTTQATTTVMEELLTTPKPTTITNPTTGTSLSRTTISNASTASSTTLETTTVTTTLTSEYNSSSISTTSISPKLTTSTLAISPKEAPSTTEINLTTRNIEKEDLSARKNPYESVESTTLVLSTTPIGKYENITITTENTNPITSTTVLSTTGSIKNTKSIYNRTEMSLDILSTTPSFDTTILTSTNAILTTLENSTKQPLITAEQKTESDTTRANIFTTTEKEITTKIETTKRPEITTRAISTVKFKPKEIWIKPTQKGESTVIDFKMKTNHEPAHPRNRIATKKEFTSDLTTPRTIIVSIIPTSVSYATFKKIALTTSSYLTMRNTNNIITKFNKTEHGFTSSMASHTSLPPFIKKIILSSTIPKNISTFSSTTPKILKNVSTLQTNLNDKDVMFNMTISGPSTTNSMASMENTPRLNLSTFLTTISTSTNSSTTTQKIVEKVTKKATMRPIKPIFLEVTTRPLTASTVYKRIDLENITKAYIPNIKTTKIPEKVLTRMNITEVKIKDPIKNLTKILTKHLTTKEPDDEIFHILTEPEHITAVMNEKERDRTSMDLISVVSIAGGVMMAVITVAVLIVMVERCRRPRFEEVRKVNDIRMQVMIDNNDAPPPYTRSIFHTPLPEPPSDKCHYQPISTLDRNLKQFMRPVVVQNISPIMLENFRGILECHYDHLPRRNHDFGTMPSRFAAAPSMSYSQELRCQKSRSVHDSTIDSMKCEAKQDVIDTSTSEPLYAEIPCWRPPSEHAIEVLNLNGEAITEL